VGRVPAKKSAGRADLAIGDLFGKPELPAGFRYMPDVISVRRSGTA
jgi:hypothetical protein